MQLHDIANYTLLLVCMFKIRKLYKISEDTKVLLHRKVNNVNYRGTLSWVRDFNPRAVHAFTCTTFIYLSTVLLLYAGVL